MTQILSQDSDPKLRPSSEQTPPTVFYITRPVSEELRAYKKEKSNAYVQSKRSKLRREDYRSHPDGKVNSQEKGYNSIFNDPSPYDEKKFQAENQGSHTKLQPGGNGRPTETSRTITSLKTKSRKINKRKNSEKKRHVQNSGTFEMGIQPGNELSTIPQHVYAAIKETNDLIQDLNQEFENMKVGLHSVEYDQNQEKIIIKIGKI